MSPKKALVLGTILLVPVLAFLFLKMFGVNRYSLRTYFPVSVDSTLVEGRWQYDTVFHRVPSFPLISQTGDTLTSQALQDKIYVANFFYTTCQGVCKQTSTQLARVQDAFRFQPDVKILSYSIHYTHDSVPVLRQYAKSFRADASKWFFLTGSKDQVEQLMMGYYVNARYAPDGFPTLENGEQLYLLDKQGHVRGIYDGTDATEIDKLITEINVLLSEYEVSHEKPS
ncbi:SCO family protein [Rufibacter roseus]|uniref:SCO family protein n=1 Tax=Rufibacter roseus TaxID=1567108 RepID=A0ABW2DM97_9BACT|nr:SCO family protein [Rufibacter roseus]